MLNYIGFTVAQLSILGLKKHKSGLGGGQDTQATVA